MILKESSTLNPRSYEDVAAIGSPPRVCSDCGNAHYSAADVITIGLTT